MIVREARPTDLQRLAALEAESYPADEAASPATLAARIAEAPDCFLLAEDPDGALLGFVCGTRSAEPELTEESMRRHDPAGSSLCVHSVVVAPTHRRAGLGSELLARYLEHAWTLAGVERLLLIAKAHLKGFYEAAGFTCLGLSPVVHGADPWFAFRLTR